MEAADAAEVDAVLPDMALPPDAAPPQAAATWELQYRAVRARLRRARGSRDGRLLCDHTIDHIARASALHPTCSQVMARLAQQAVSNSQLREQLVDHFAHSALPRCDAQAPAKSYAKGLCSGPMARTT